MQREKIDSLNEKNFVVSLIMSDKVCKTLIPYINLDYFDVEYSRIVTQWVIDYYKKFNKSPKDDITSLYITHHDEIQDEATKNLIASFLQNLADSNLNINNEDYLFDRSKDFLDKKALEKYTEELNACLAVNDIEKARKIQSKYKKIAPTETNEISLFDKKSVKKIQEALGKVDEELMTLPENFNRVTGKLHRNDFVAILAGAKAGKSWAMQYLATHAVQQGLNVVFVSMEMSEEEVVQRMWKMLYGSKSGIVPEGIYEGAKIIEDPNDPEKFTSQLFDIKVRSSAAKSVRHLQKQTLAQNQHKGDLRIIAYPSYGASVKDITDRIEELAVKENFVADVVVIDYADITQPIGGGSELRNQLDAIWKHLRWFAMQFHCLIITASQTNRKGIGASEVDADSIAEDIRKMAHCTSMISLEKTKQMKREHLIRVRNIAVRNDNVEETCVFPQCLDIGQFMLQSPVLGKDFNFPGDDEND